MDDTNLSKTQLVASIPGPDFETAEKHIEQAHNYADIIELRLDMFGKLDIQKLEHILNITPLPIIFTLRPKIQGGCCEFSETERMEKLLQLASLKPDYFDLECMLSKGFFEDVHKLSPGTKIICSYHDFQKTPEDLDSLLMQMKKPHVHIYKISTTAQNFCDALRMCCFLKNKTNVAGMTMGIEGSASRILGPIVGSRLTYASIQETTAEGQLSVKDLCDLYHFHELNSDTKIYALIGDPIDKSPGHYIHNKSFKILNKNAVYIKIRVATQKIEEFFRLIDHLPFGGLSITMPHKEKVHNFLDYIDPSAEAIGAINTIVIKDNKYTGYNTDAPGALEAIEAKHSIEGEHIVILGAGGSARAIAYEALKRNAKVLILNRNKEKAENLAAELGCLGAGLDRFPKVAEAGYKILINTTSVGMNGAKETPIPARYILPKRTVMDIVNSPMHTQLLREAALKGNDCIYGYEMFINQALLQQVLWFELEKVDEDVRKMMEKFFS